MFAPPMDPSHNSFSYSCILLSANTSKTFLGHDLALPVKFPNAPRQIRMMSDDPDLPFPRVCSKYYAIYRVMNTSFLVRPFSSFLPSEGCFDSPLRDGASGSGLSQHQKMKRGGRAALPTPLSPLRFLSPSWIRVTLRTVLDPFQLDNANQ